MKRFISTLTLFAFAVSPMVADQPPEAAVPVTEQSEPVVANPEVKEVKKEDEAVSTKNSRWVDFAIAVSAIAVAITALVMVKRNRGK